MRFKGASETLWEAYPQDLLGLAEAVTALGGAEGVVLVLALTYWLVDRERAARVTTFAVAGIAIVIILKNIFAMPRPVADGATRAVIDYEPEGYGFPSGHAFTATVVYGGFLYVFDKVREPKWFAGIGLLVVSIAFSRVFIRVHYLGDIIAGTIVGLVFLLAMDAVVRDQPQIGFAIGAVLAVPALLISGDAWSLVHVEEGALVGLGSGIGGFLACFQLDAIPRLQSRVEGAILTVLGLGYIVGASVVSAIAIGEVGTVTTNLLIVGWHIALIVGIFLLPVVSHHLEAHRQRVMRADAEQAA